MNCVKCGKELSEVFPEIPHRRKEDQNKYPLVDALMIGFVGGYGMFFDDENKRFMLCHSCAHDLINANSWMLEVFEQWHNSTCGITFPESKDLTPDA